MLVILRAVLFGAVVLLAGSTPWGGFPGLTMLAGWNIRVWVSVPWSVVPMSLYLWVYWRYLNGAGWPQSTAAARRTNLRANRVSADIWVMSIFAGFIGLAALLPLTRILSRLTTLPEENSPATISQGMPFVTMLVLLVM